MVAGDIHRHYRYCRPSVDGRSLPVMASASVTIDPAVWAAGARTSCAPSAARPVGLGWLAAKLDEYRSTLDDVRWFGTQRPDSTAAAAVIARYRRRVRQLASLLVGDMLSRWIAERAAARAERMRQLGATAADRTAPPRSLTQPAVCHAAVHALDLAPNAPPAAVVLALAGAAL